MIGPSMNEKNNIFAYNIPVQTLLNQMTCDEKKFS